MVTRGNPKFCGGTTAVGASQGVPAAVPLHVRHEQYQAIDASENSGTSPGDGCAGSFGSRHNRINSCYLSTNQ